MTPEERARNLMETLIYNRGLGFNLVVSIHEAVRDAIRAAENEALERAARRITVGYSWMTESSVGTAEDCAKAIRALKHGCPL